MTLTIFTSGTKAKASEVNSNQNDTLRLIGQNTIQTLQDRAITFSADGGEWAEAYTDSNGRLNSVDIDYRNTTSIFDTNKYKCAGITDEASSDTTHDPDTLTNPENAFDTDDATYATTGFASVGSSDTSLGKTFASKLIDIIRYKVSYLLYNDSSVNILVETYNGATWDIADTYVADVTGANGTTKTFDNTIFINDTIQGIRVTIDATRPGAYNSEHRFYSIEYGDFSSSIITHTIPTGTFSSTISTSFLTFKAEDWEDGADIQYKLTNTGGDDSGWLNTNEVVKFTAFTAEPDTCIVKLIPKTSSPTAGYPSINGVFLTGTKP